jgi:hypothetical protein
MTPGFAKPRSELPWLPYGKCDRVIINAHNFTPPVTLTGVFTAAPPTPTRNNFSGSLGMRFTPVSGFTLKAMGRFAGSLFTGSHQVRIYNAALTLLGSVTITTSSPSDALGYRYELLSSNIVLAAATQYWVGVTETSGGDNWQDLRSTSGYVNASVIGSIVAGYSLSQNAVPNITVGSAGDAYVFPQLYY